MELRTFGLNLGIPCHMSTLLTIDEIQNNIGILYYNFITIKINLIIYYYLLILSLVNKIKFK